MAKPMIRIHDLENDKIIDREMTVKELAQYEADKVKAQAQAQAEAAKAAARQVILDRLGLTADEAALLLGAN